MKTPGQIAYEAELAEWPLYGNGDPRPAWEKLSGYVRSSWELNPTPRANPGWARRLTPEQRADL